MSSLLERLKNYPEVQEKVEKIIFYFAPLEFEEERHLYTVEGQQLISVSGKIKNYVEPFDADKIAGFVAKSRGISKAEVLMEWEVLKNAACDKGTRVHLFGETYSEGDVPQDGFEEAIVNFWKELPEHLLPVIFELKMYSKKWGLAGTGDLLFYNLKTGKFVIGDYKTNKDLFKNHKGKRMLKPFSGKLDMPLSKYELQLSYYQLLFEQTGFEVENRFLIWVKGDGTYSLHDTEDLTRTIKKQLDYDSW